MPLPTHGQLTTSLLLKTLEQVGAIGVNLARIYLARANGSKTLQDYMDFVVDSTTTHEAVGRVTVPFHWAEYVHDGRGPIVMPPGAGYLCFFPNKRDDPRTKGGKDYAGSKRLQGKAHRLSKAEFFFYLSQNNERQAVGLPPIMVVTRFVGPVRKKIKFFELGLRNLAKEAGRIVPVQFQLVLQQRGLLGTRRQDMKARIG